MRPRIVTAAAALAVALGAAVWAISPDVSADGRSDDSGVNPVITADEPWNAYPAAGVEAVLVLREDCLLLGEYVVFWPYGTTWDESAQAVVFADHFAAVVGEFFKGGGGEYGPDVDFESLIGTEAADAIRACLHKTNLSEVVVAAHSSPDHAAVRADDES